MKTPLLTGILFCCLLLSTLPAVAQLASPNEAGVTLSHIQLIVNDVDAHKQFWTTVMGGRLVEHGPFTMIAFPEVFVVLEKGPPIGPSEGTVLNHFGFAYKDLAGQVARWKGQNVDVRMNANGNQGYVYGPDGARVEIAADPDLPVPFRMDHLHMNLPDIASAQAWYEKNFGGRTGQRKRNAGPGFVECSYFPDTTISFTSLGRGASSPLLPTKGRGLDHFGFEVLNLNAFVKKLQAEGVTFESLPQMIPGTRIMSAFLTDPWGNSIEITENFISAAH
jgi:catechol 2,3-dioxygenase-like lactoylglutathione lyase family enzyme